MKLVVATCQFPVSSDIQRNAGWVLRQMDEARQRGAHVAHFCECASRATRAPSAGLEPAGQAVPTMAGLA